MTSGIDAEDTLTLQATAVRTSLRDEAIKTLQAAIIAGELRPHVVYSAPTLAARLGMSATPVREAVLDLVNQGLVETVRNKGFRVVELAAEELDELTELRLLIEVPSVRALARRGLSDEEHERLQHLAAQIERAAVRNDMVAHNKADLEFHTALLGLLSNKTLVSTVQSLRVRSRLYGMARLADSGQLLPTSREHTELLDLIRDGDAEGAAQLMRRHIGHVRGSWATGAAEEETMPHVEKPHR
ncbi:MAG TPA: GntR family transcriptional regulator [Jatrophihabitans sp.]|jgi:DNA-binding GntR family transcriptional regulator|uniref:GntR family transcriptional regulator n=1 Tax=Jatrophihabitans sp. TaxID=1932789 RepID=UPI002F0474F8